MASLFYRRLSDMSFSRLHFLRKRFSSGAGVAALKPFYFAVHPDFLWQHPMKKEVNEKSLKQLNQFIESLQNNASLDGPTSLPFYLRKTADHSDHPLVNIPLDRSSLSATIRSIFVSCNLPLLDEDTEQELAIDLDNDAESHRNKCHFYRKLYAYKETTMAAKVAKSKNIDLFKFLCDRRDKAQALILGTGHTRKTKDYEALCVKDRLRLKAIVWDNQWTCFQHRNCITDLVRLSEQYQKHIHHLINRTLVFGNETGCHLSGDLVFGCGDSRRLWVELLQSVPENDKLLRKIRKAESELMNQLPGTRIVYRHCSPALNLGKHLHWLQRLSSVLRHYGLDNKVPAVTSREPVRIIIDSNAAEMELLKSGEMVICPHLSAEEVVNFLTINSTLAAKNMESFTKETYQELAVQEKCSRSLGVGFLYKDEKLTPEEMISCCERLLQHHQQLKKMCQNLYLCISEYYVLIEDGTLCIPWNWKSENNKIK